MAFTEAQKVKIRHYLGFPDVYRYANPRLESAMDVIGERPDTKAMIEEIMAEVAAGLLALSPTNDSGLHTQAGLKKVDEIEFFGDAKSGTVSAASDSMKTLVRENIGRLSIAFGVPVVHDIVGGGGYKLDSWGSEGFQGGGNIIPLG